MGGKIPEGTCLEEGCDKPRREGKARCDEHQKALQNATYQKTKGKKAAHHKEAKKPETPVDPIDPRPGRLPDRNPLDPRPAPEEPIKLPAPLVFEADLIPLKITISLGEMVDLIPPLRNWQTEMEARAFLLGFFNGRRVA